MTNSKCALSLWCEILSPSVWRVNCGKLNACSTAATPLDVTQEPCRRQTHPHKQCGVFDSDCYSKQKNIYFKVMTKWILLLTSGVNSPDWSICVPHGTINYSAFYIRHYSGLLCSAWRPIGLIVDRLRPLINCSPRQRASFQHLLKGLTVAAIIPGLRRKQ